MNTLKCCLLICALSKAFAMESENILDPDGENYIGYSNTFDDLNKNLVSLSTGVGNLDIYRGGLNHSEIEKTITEIKAKFMQNSAWGEAAWKVYLEEVLVHRLMRYYEINTQSWNKQLLELTDRLKPIVSAAAWEKVISNLLENRLPMGIIKNKKSSGGLFTGYLPTSNSESRTQKYLEQEPTSTIWNDPLATNQGTGAAVCTAEVPVGYYLLMPDLNQQPKGLIIHVYGGLTAEEQGEKYKGSPNIFDKKLLSQGYAIAYLNLADLYENYEFQTRMLEETFDKILAGINLFIEAIKGSAIHVQVNSLAIVPIFLMGESFGGATVAGFMRKYPKKIAGGISLNGALCYQARNKPCEDYLDPSTQKNLKALQDPLLVLQAWNDNNVISGELKIFLKCAEQASVTHLIHPFMIKMANETVDKGETALYIGHLLKRARSEDLDRVVQQVLSFMVNPSKPSASDQAIDARRTSIINSLTPLNSNGQSFEDILKAMTRKWYEERLNASGNTPAVANKNYAKTPFMNDQWFENQWIEYYLPKYVALIHEMAADTFEINIGANIKKEAEDRVNSLPKSHVNEGLWKAQIEKLLRQELQPIGLDDYLTARHINEVTESVGRGKITKPFSARIAFQALAKIYVEETQELKRVKAQMLGWIQVWRIDSRKVWRKMIFDETGEKIQLNERVHQAQASYQQKQ